MRLINTLLTVMYWTGLVRAEDARDRAASWWDGDNRELERLRVENRQLRQDLAAARTLDAARRRDNDVLRRWVDIERSRKVMS